MPEQVTRRDPAAQQLEVGVPDPGHVAAVGDVVVQREPEVERALLERQRAQHLVRAGGVLDEQDRDVAPVDRDRLHAAEGAAEALQRRLDVVEAGAQLEAVRRGGERVVDVVEPGEREPQRELAPGRG